MRNITNQEFFKYGVNSGALPGDPLAFGTIRLRYPENGLFHKETSKPA